MIFFVPDSGSYINNNIMRTPGYPLFIDFFKLIFGEFYVYPLIITQYILLFTCIFVFASGVGKVFDLHKKYQLTIGIILLLICLNGPYLLNGYVASESIAYPIFLLFVLRSIEVIKGNKTKIYQVLMLLYLLICIRPQFLFALPSLSIVFILRNKWKYVFYFILVIFTSFSTDIIYQRIYNNHWTTAKILGIQLSCVGIYLSSTDDATGLPTEQEQIVREVISEAYAFNYTRDSFQNTTNNTYSEQFQFSYDRILYNIYLPKIGELYNNQVEIDDQSRRIGIFLLMKHIPEFISLVCNNMLRGMGGAENLLFFLILLSSSLLFWWKYKSDINIILTFLCFLHFSNILLVAMIQTCAPRYLFYTQHTLLVYVSVLLVFSLHNLASVGGAASQGRREAATALEAKLIIRTTNQLSKFRNRHPPCG